ncbi:MAG: TetR/AcrR family transcriptional regulator [Clostridium sp.]
MTKGTITKAKIAHVAWKLFHEKGYEDTTIDEIIMKSGTSKGSFYHYYSGKDALLASLSEVFDDKYEEVIQTLDPEMDSFEKLLLLCYNTHDMIEKEIPVGLLASLYSSQVVTQGDKHLLDQNRFYYRLINQLVDEGQRRGQITNEMPYYEVARLYTLCERAIIYDYCISNGNYPLGEYTRRTMPLIFGGVKAKPSTKE